MPIPSTPTAPPSDAQRLHLSEELYRLTLVNISDAVFITDDKGRFTFICPNAHVIFGYTEQEIWQLGTIDALLNDLTWESRQLDQAGELVNMETDIQDKQGRTHSLLVNIKRVAIDRGSILISCRDITERKKAETALSQLNETLEDQVRHKTAALQEANAALRGILQHREQDNHEMRESILQTTRQLIEPYLNRLKNSRLTRDQRTLLGIIHANLREMVEPHAASHLSMYYGLTPMEIQVANLIKTGKANKEIAAILNIAKGTVQTHRHNLRKKLGLKNKKVNLGTHLRSFS